MNAKVGLMAALLMTSLALAGRGEARVRPAWLPDDPMHLFIPVGDEQGLATRTVAALAQDRDGFVWIGTRRGLFRYDGAQVEGMTREDESPWTAISQLIAGEDGKLWVSGKKAAGYYEGGRFTPIRMPVADDLRVRSVDLPQGLALAQDAALYVASTRGLHRLGGPDYELEQTWTTADGLPDDNVVAVHVDRKGRLWAAAGGRVGLLGPDGRFSFTDLFGEQPSERVIAVLVDREGVVWARSQTGLFRAQGPGSPFQRDDRGIAEALGVGKPSLDGHGRIMVPSRIGLFTREEGRWQVLSARNGLRTSAVASVMQDREGQHWFGLDGGGVSLWPGGRRWAAWTSQNGLPDDCAWDILLDRQQRLWVGTDNGIGVWTPATKTWETLQKEDGLVGHGVWKVLEDAQGTLWSISRRVGLNRFEPDSLRPLPVELPPECGSGPTDLAYDAAGRQLWVAGNDYLLRGRREGDPPRQSWEQLPLPKAIIGCTEVVAIAPDGVVWTGGRRGIGRYHEGRWRHFDVSDGLLEADVEYLSPVDGEEVWVDYESPLGISRLRFQRGAVELTHVSQRDGLLSDAVWLLEQDPLGDLWVGHADGISVLRRGAVVRSYNRGMGLVWNDISQGAFLGLPDGSAFVGTSRGLAFRAADAEAPPPVPPKVVITEALLGGRELLGRPRLEVEHDENALLIRFSGLSFRDPGGTRFRYRLGGLERELVETRSRELRYAGLAPGSYRFEVHCRSSAGLWSPSPAQLEFVIRPPWWELWWARGGAVVLALLLIVLVFRIRTYRLAEDRRRLELAVAKRNAQLAEANQQLVQANEELRELSFTDSLTRVHNRHFFTCVIDAEVSAVRRRQARCPAGQPNSDLIFFIVDVDRFKDVNDQYGHAIGDQVLIETARRLGAGLRQGDLLVRWGGEEFLALCRDAELSQAATIADRLLRMMASEAFALPDGRTLSKTCSVGWAPLPLVHPRGHRAAYEVAIELADKGLYLAKESGRNRAVGLEYSETAFQDPDGLEWLERPLEEVDGAQVTLVRSVGPEPPEQAQDS